MAKISTTVVDVVNNIATFNSELKASEKLQERLSYVRGWYAVKAEDGNWMFGPSKFIGYQRLTADDYTAPNAGLDGRKTEAQLEQWFQKVDVHSELYEELRDALIEFLDGYDKEPSRAARISILNSDWDNIAESGDHHASIVKLIVEVSRSLPTPYLRALREQLGA